MPECRLCGSINNAEEGASKREKIFQITNGTKFHAKCELPLNCFTLGPIYWNGDSLEPVTMWIDLFF